MSAAAFRSLILEFAKHVGLPDPETVAQTGQFKIDDFHVAIFFDEQLNPDAIFTYVDFGEVPEGREQAAYRAMLEANLAVGGPLSGVLGIHPDSGRAVFSVQVHLAKDLSGREFAEAIEHFVGQAHYWREEIGLSGSDRVVARPPDSHFLAVRT